MSSPQIRTSITGRRRSNQQNSLSVRATCAAPGYFKSFPHAASKYTFDDGAVTCNNPVFVADKERKVLWPEQAAEDPDIFLSVGTGFDTTPAANPTGASLAVPKSGITSYIRKMINLASAAVSDDMNCEMVWQDYIKGIGLDSESVDPDRSRRYQRLNLAVEGPIPSLDAVDHMESLQNQVRQYIIRSSKIKEVARVLQASLFYYELNIVSGIDSEYPSFPKNRWDYDLHCTGND